MNRSVFVVLFGILVFSFADVFAESDYGIYEKAIKGMSDEKNNIPGHAVILVSSNTSWSGHIGSGLGGGSTKSGTGDARFVVECDNSLNLMQGNFQKETEDGFLAVNIVQYGNSLAYEITTSPFGIAHAVADNCINRDLPSDFNWAKITSSTILIPSSEDFIDYEITGGKLLGAARDVPYTSLSLAVDTNNYGSLTLTIPRSVFDATMNGNDIDFVVLIDDHPAEFDERSTSTERALAINFPPESQVIEIIGTFVVPEFGTIAAMILAVAIISIIAISAKSRLSIMPRY